MQQENEGHSQVPRYKISPFWTAEAPQKTFEWMLEHYYVVNRRTCGKSLKTGLNESFSVEPRRKFGLTFH